MLPARRLATAVVRRPALTLLRNACPAVALPPRRFYAAATEPPEQIPEYLSVPLVNGVPIVSNFPTTEGAAHPDPEMTGGYINPPPEKRQFRSPYQTYWDQQDRRNYGEAVNEDEDILGRLSPEVYTWTSPKMGLIQNAMFIAAVFGLTGLCYLYYPDKPAVPRTFPYDGLREELGGVKAPAARSEADEI